MPRIYPSQPKKCLVRLRKEFEVGCCEENETFYLRFDDELQLVTMILVAIKTQLREGILDRLSLAILDYDKSVLEQFVLDVYRFPSILE